MLKRDYELNKMDREKEHWLSYRKHSQGWKSKFKKTKRIGEEETGAVSVDHTFYFFLWNLIAF